MAGFQTGAVIAMTPANSYFITLTGHGNMEEEFCSLPEQKYIPFKINFCIISVPV